MGCAPWSRGRMMGVMRRVTLKNVPGIVWACVTVAFVAVLAALVIMAAIGADSTELTRFLNLIMNTAILIVGGAGAVYSGAAAKSAQDAAQQTNGQLDQRITDAVAQALTAQRAADVAPGGEFRQGGLR
jgi:ABC-type transport system involved in cytochrome bd biosynthesis fused ATPase/permease subunit